MKLRSILSVSFAMAAFSVFGADQNTIQVPKAILDRHNLACPEFNSERGQYMTKEVYTLPNTELKNGAKTLYILGCELYAYNTMEKAYIVDSYGDITSVAVAEVANDRSVTATTDLMGAMYDQASLKLLTYSKGRGIGDCGSSSAYKYDDNSNKFVLLEARLKVDCDGDAESDWPIVYSK